jgi:hypothetical protein
MLGYKHLSLALIVIIKKKVHHKNIIQNLLRFGLGYYLILAIFYKYLFIELLLFILGAFSCCKL